MRTIFSILSLFLLVQIGFSQPYPDSQTDGEYIEVNGAKLWTVRHGDGPPLFFIAGGPGGSHPGLRSFDPLSDEHTLVYFDALGRGKSDLAKEVTEYSIDRDVEDLEGLRKAMGYDKIAILGHSYGGVVAQGYAVKYPEHVSHLILANSFHSYLMWQANDDNCNHEIRTNYPEVWDTLMIVREQGYVSQDEIHQEIYSRVPYGFLYAYNPDKFVRRGKPSGTPYPNRFNPDVYYQMVGKDGDFIVGSDIGNFDYRTKLKDLPMPILVIAGRFDRVAVPREMVKYKTYCPQCEFVMFEKSGHNPQVEEQEEEFALIRRFLTR
ncbi:MAG: alpha/beta fold hydrolase [Lewinellaceae bacterium]|nr:alpha/beta fold hydrolase [Lewinellaceae bacterium]HRW75375.1 alpha/beta hydrolase [Saprospiraceae bacterium]